MARHTKGPWEFIEGLGVIRATNPEHDIATLLWLEDDDLDNEPLRPETLANARLMAASPRLLEACRAAWEELTYGNGDVDFISSQLKAAIAEATGEEA